MIKQIVTASVMALASSLAAAMPRASQPPIGYSIFCMRNPHECRPAVAVRIEKNAANWPLLNKINKAVNASIRPVADKAENWSVNVKTGDCEDYALTKRSRLIRAGIPAGALRMADVTTSRGERHAVLVVKTTSGDYVLDNLRGGIIRREFTGYRFNGVASANPMKW